MHFIEPSANVIGA